MDINYIYNNASKYLHDKSIFFRVDWMGNLAYINNVHFISI